MKPEGVEYVTVGGQKTDDSGNIVGIGIDRPVLDDDRSLLEVIRKQAHDHPIKVMVSRVVVNRPKGTAVAARIDSRVVDVHRSPVRLCETLSEQACPRIAGFEATTCSN